MFIIFALNNYKISKVTFNQLNVPLLNKSFAECQLPCMENHHTNHMYMTQITSHSRTASVVFEELG